MSFTPARRSIPGKDRRLIVFAAGTRPEWLKLASTMRRLHEFDPESMVVLDIQQQPSLVGPLLPHYGLDRLPRLEVPSDGPELGRRLGRTTTTVDAMLERIACAAMVVQGDTTSALAASLAAFYARIPIVHVEAGLRSNDMRAPFPEEGHRAMITQIATWHVPTTDDAADRLARLGVPRERMVPCRNPLFDLIPAELTAGTGASMSRTVLVTMHRRENHDRGIPALCAALRDLVNEVPTVDIVVVAHPHPAVRQGLAAHLDGHVRIRMVPPVPHRAFLGLLAEARLVLTDSGGVQEEAAWLEKDTLLLRRLPDRPDGIAGGRTVVCPPERHAISARALQLLAHDPRPPTTRKTGTQAGDVIAGFLRREFGAAQEAVS